MKILKGSLLIIILLYVGFGCAVQQDGLTNEEAKNINNNYEQMWEKGNSGIAYELLDTSYVMVSPFFPQGIKGVNTLEEFIKNNSISFPDFKLKVDDFYVKDNLILSYWTISGTNTGPLGDLPATGKNIKVSGFAVSKIKNGKIYDEQTFWNVLEFYQQLGFQVIPPAAEVAGGN
jgi:steroid delta-isomerase-like uncharacterized protein